MDKVAYYRRVAEEAKRAGNMQAYRKARKNMLLEQAKVYKRKEKK